MYERILVPLDGSETAEVALRYVELLPSRQVWLLSVENERVDLSAVCKAASDCRAYLEQVAEPLRQRGEDVATFVVLGNPAEQILKFAATADLVVMGSHGHGAAERFVLGSVADQVARRAPVPTMIVRGPQGTASAARIMRLVVPLDGSTLAEQALPVAAELAGYLEAPIHLVRVVDADPVRAAIRAGVPAATASMRLQQEDVRHAEAYLAERVQALGAQHLAASAEVPLGSPSTTLLDLIRADDLVVMATHGRGGVRRWVLGSVAEKVVCEATAPVLLLRATGRDSL